MESEGLTEVADLAREVDKIVAKDRPENKDKPKKKSNKGNK